ncbi:TRAP transporter large permease [Haloferax marisrubri]|uniref:TRAP transporter large permease n=1 Tax=Haloferax marisrubri TaxID=1544719 RepID=A0A2P4NMC8_9EURY|nr:TRAP transporter large permease [Haloferax marisrubri]POG54295.1 TRAP transporter large permease [Haloferax marisrubri]
MSELLIVGGLFLGILLLLYAIGVPVAVAMGVSVVVMWVSPYGNGIDFTLISNQLFYGVNSYPLLAVPFYVLLGRLMNRIGMTERIFDFAGSIVGHYRGGIAQVNIVASMIFSGMSGLATADAAGLGRIEYAAMRENGYDKKTALGVTGSSALIGPLIPPSVAIIIYGVLADESIGKLFMGGFLPGIIMGLALMVFVVVLSYHYGFEPDSEFEASRVWETFKHSIFALLTPVIIIGGLLSGQFTATEAGAIGVVFIVLVGSLVYRNLSANDIVQEMKNSMIETCALTFIIAVASLYGLVALQLQLPRLLVDGFAGVSSDPTMLLLSLTLLFLVVGTFMDTIAAMTVLVPIIMPLITLTNIDPIHFGVVMLLALLLGLLTPPFGIILFVLEKVTDASLEEVMKGVLPYYIPVVTVLLLCIFFPDLVTYIPRELIG